MKTMPTAHEALLSDLDPLPRAIVAIATDYPPGHLLDWHEHRRAQLLYGATGTMLVETADGAWTVPPERAVAIPPETPHRVRMLDVVTNSLYLEPSAVPWWPQECTVVEVSALLRELLAAAVRMPAEYDLAGRDGALAALLLHELHELAPLPFHISLPRTPEFVRLCRAYLREPDAGVSNAEWARTLAMSERSFTRAFRADVGESPAAWRMRARLLAALPLLQQHTVTEVAMQLGYSSPASFSAAFTHTFGRAPSALSGPRVTRR